jgi:hypothetical protein
LAVFQPFTAWTLSEQNSQILKLSENKRIEASICADSMNRIAVANDRITQIFGDEGTFESQNDEATGQIFLKPTPDNGPKNLSLTLITEQGVTQDLTLKPTEKSAKTLILGRNPSGQGPRNRDLGNQPHQNQHFVGSIDQPAIPGALWKSPGDRFASGNDLALQEGSRLNQILTLLKQAITGQLPFNEDTHAGDDHARGARVGYGKASRQHPCLERWSLTLSQSWQAGPYDVHAFQVENVSEAPLELQEKDFYEPGDLALSLEARVLAVQGKTALYVVCPRKADFL